MRQLLLGFLLVLTLAACAPAVFDPDVPPATGVTTEVLQVDVGATYRVEMQQPADRLVLLFTGSGLQVNADECSVTPVDVACSVRDVLLFYEITVVGEVTRAEGIVERDGSFGLFTFSP